MDSTNQVLGEALIKIGRILSEAGRELRKLDAAQSPPTQPPDEPSLMELLGRQRAAALWATKRVAYWRSTTVEAMTGKGRTQNEAQARQLVWYVLRQTTPMSLPELGRLFDRNHTTVLSGINRIAEHMRVVPDNYPWMAQLIQEVEAVLRGETPNASP